MKDEVRRIMKLVQEGKLSPDDAAELIDAFSEAPSEEEPRVEEPAEAPTEDPHEEGGEEGGAPKSDDPFKRMVESIESIGKDVTQKMDWGDIAGQVKEGVGKGVEAIKKAAKDAGVEKGFESIFGSQEGKTVELPLDVPEGKVLRVEMTSGSVDIKASEELGQVTSTAKFRSYSIEEAKKKADLYSPFIEENDQYVTLKLQDGPDSTVDATVHVKPGTPVEVAATSGEVWVTDTAASCKVDAASARVSLKGVAGAVDVDVSSGDCRVMDSEASVVSIETKSGRVDVLRTKAAMNVRSSSGHIRISESSGRTLSVDTATGDVYADLCEPVDGSVSLRTVSGDIRLELPDGCDARVKLSTIKGQVTSDVDLEDAATADTAITGTLGEGSGSIDASAVNGSIVLAYRDAQVADQSD